jgi:hypothetical protein
MRTQVIDRRSDYYFAVGVLLFLTLAVVAA